MGAAQHCCVEEKLQSEVFVDYRHAAIAADLVQVEKYTPVTAPCEYCCDNGRPGQRPRLSLDVVPATLATEEAVLPGNAHHWHFGQEKLSALSHWSFEFEEPPAMKSLRSGMSHALGHVYADSEASLSDDGIRVMAAALPAVKPRKRVKKRKPPPPKTWLDLDDVAHVKAAKARQAAEIKHLDKQIKAYKEWIHEQAEASWGDESDDSDKDFFGVDGEAAVARVNHVRLSRPPRLLGRPAPELSRWQQEEKENRHLSVATLRAHPNSAPDRKLVYMANRMRDVPTDKASRMMMPTHY